MVATRMTPGSAKTTGMAYALIAAAAFAMSGPLAKPLLEAGWSPGAAVLLRIGGAALVLLVPLILVLRTTGFHVVRSHGRLLVAYGAIPVAGAQLGFFNAVQTLPVGVALLLEYTAPVIVVAWLWVRRGQRPGLTTAVGGLVAMAGLVLVLDLSGGASLDPRGVAWALGAALCVTAYFLLSAQQHDDLSPLLTIAVGMVVGTIVVAVAGLSGMLPMAFTTADAVLAGATVPWWLPAAGLVLITAVMSYIIGLVAVQKLGSRLASFVALVEVLLAVVLAWLLLGQLPAPIQLLGGALIIGGVILVRLGESDVRPTSPASWEPATAPAPTPPPVATPVAPQR